MKILILQGGTTPAASTRRAPRNRGVMAIDGGDGRWVMVNVSAPVAHQLGVDARLDIHSGLPDAAVRAVVLTDGQVDHVGGLLSLRDGAPIDLYATPAVFEELTTSMPVLPVLQHYCGVHWHVIPVAGDRAVAQFQVEGVPALEFTALAIDTPAPPYALRSDHPMVGDAVALAVRDRNTGQRVFCVPAAAQLGGHEIDWMREADCLLLEGLNGASANGHHGGSPAAAGWLDLLADLPARHKVWLDSDGPPDMCNALHRNGIALAYDGMEIVP